MQGRLLLSALLAAAAASSARAQSQTSPPAQPASPDLRQVLERLDRLEQQNRALMTEIVALRAVLSRNGTTEPGAAGPAPVSITEEGRSGPVPYSRNGTTEPGAAGPAPVSITEEGRSGPVPYSRNGTTEPGAAASPQVSEPAQKPSADDAATVAERVEVQEQRTAQLDQEKISTEHKLPLTLTGMLLFNSFWTGKGGGGADNPTIAPPASGPVDAGATFRQSVLGAKFDG